MKMPSLKQRDLKLGKVAHAAVPATQDPKAGRALEPQERGVIICTGTFRAWDVEMRGLGVQGQPQTHSECEARLSQKPKIYEIKYKQTCNACCDH